MANRTVSITLRANFGDVAQDAKRLSRQLEETGGAAAMMRKRLEAATERLPKIKIDADSSPAEVRFAELRRELESLSGKRIGIDVDAESALFQMGEIQRGLEEIARTEADPIVRADVRLALEELRAVGSELDRLDGRVASVRAEADVAGALAGLTKLGALAAATAAIPVGASMVAGFGALLGPLSAAGLGIGAFAAIAVPAIGKVQKAIEAGKIDELSAAEQELAKSFVAFGDAYDDFQQKVSPDVWPTITGGLDLTMKLLPTLTPLIKATGGALLELEGNAQKGLNGKAWNDFIANVSEKAPAAITGLGRVGGDVFRGLGGVITAFLPYTDQVIAALEKGSTSFETWGTQLGGSNGFREFLTYVQTVGPDVIATVKNLADVGGDVVTGFAPLGVGALSGLRLLSDILAGMSPGQIQAVALAVGAVYGAVKTGQLVSAGVTALSNLREKIASVGDASSGAKGKISGLASVLGAGGPWGAALAAGVTVVGLFAARHADAEQRVRDLTDAIREDSGAIGDNTRAKVANILQTDGLLKKARDLGIDVKTFTDAALGQKDALAQVNGQLGATATNIAVYGGRAGQGTIATKQLTGTADELSNALNSTNSEVGRAIEAYQLEAAAKGESATASTTAGSALATLGTQASTTAGQVAGLNTQLGSFNGLAGNADTAAITFKGSVDHLADSLRENGRTLDINSEKGRTNRLAIIDAAKAAADHAAKVFEQTGSVDKANAVLNKNASELRAVMRDAGLSETAIDKLIKKYLVIPKSAKTEVSSPGLEKSVREMERLGKAVTDLPPSKTINVTVRTERQEFAAKISQQKKATGGIDRYAAGGIDYAAAAGMQLRPQPPQVVSRPTVLYGEGSSGRGGTEAYIPYEGRFRGRAVELLGEVADDFGLALYNKQAARQVSQVSITVEDASTQLGAGMRSAVTTLSATLGDTGSLTSAIGDVGAVGEAMTAGWTSGALQLGESVVLMGSQVGASVTGMSGSMTSSIDTLSVSVAHLGDALTAAAEKTSTASASGGSKSKSKSKSKSGGVRATGRGEAPPRSKGGMIAGSEPVDMIGGSNVGGFTTGSSGLTMGSPVNTSRVSAPQQISAAGGAANYGGLSTTSGARGGGTGGGSGGSSVNFYGTTIRETVDADVVNAKIGQALDSRG